jgi:hypothetical protein
VFLFLDKETSKPVDSFDQIMFIYWVAEKQETDQDMHLRTELFQE